MARFASRWFRAYDEAIDDPKLRLLSDRQFRFLFNCWCLASKNGGFLPPVPAMAWTMRMKESAVTSLISELSAEGLLERQGDHIRPHNWPVRQFESDISTERVRRFRERRATVSPAVSSELPETKMSVSVSVSDSVSEEKRITSLRPLSARDYIEHMKPGAADLNGQTSQRFPEWWELWAAVRGSNKKTAACQAFVSVVSLSVEEACMECTRSYLAHLADPGRGYNPENFLFEQARDGFQARWPPRKLSRSETLDKLLSEEGNG